MKGHIVKGPSREELAKAMFIDGPCVPFTIRERGTRREIVVMAKVTGAESDGTYHEGKRNGFELKGNCYTFGENSLRRERFECLYNVSAVEIDPVEPTFGSFHSGADINSDCDVCHGPCIGADA